MAFKMKPSTYLKPKTRSMSTFKQTGIDPPSGTVSSTRVSYDPTGRQYTEEGAGIQQGSEWYQDATQVDYNTLTDDQKAVVQGMSVGREDLSNRVYEKGGKLYFDQGTYWGDEQGVEEALLVDESFGSGEQATTSEQDIVEEEEGVNFTESIGGFTVGGSKNQHTFSTKNPYLPSDGSKKFTDRRRMQLARKWERQNNTDKTRSASSRFGDTFEE